MLLCTLRLCCCKLLDRLNVLLHTGHLYGFSPVWTLMWVFRPPDSLKALSHRWHLYGFSSLWILLCLATLPDRLNRLLQTLHSNGFSPEWVRLCTVKSWLFRKLFPHSLQLYLLLCIFICEIKLQRVVKHLSHWVHVNISSPPVCDLRCRVKVLFIVNRFSQTVHTYDLVLCWVISLLSASVSTAVNTNRTQDITQMVPVCECNIQICCPEVEMSTRSRRICVTF